MLKGNISSAMVRHINLPLPVPPFTVSEVSLIPRAAPGPVESRVRRRISARCVARWLGFGWRRCWLRLRLHFPRLCLGAGFCGFGRLGSRGRGYQQGRRRVGLGGILFEGGRWDIFRGNADTSGRHRLIMIRIIQDVMSDDCGARG